jgi:hypothetical protein
MELQEYHIVALQNSFKITLRVDLLEVRRGLSTFRLASDSRGDENSDDEAHDSPDHGAASHGSSAASALPEVTDGTADHQSDGGTEDVSNNHVFISFCLKPELGETRARTCFVVR